MNKPKRTYSASELAATAHVPLRTIRYYRNQRLLPAPEGRGPAARYTDEHLEVLNAIHGSRNYLPLAQIRRDLPQIRQVLAALPAEDAASEPDAATNALFFTSLVPASSTDTAAPSEEIASTDTSEDSAAEYAARVLRSMAGDVQVPPAPNTGPARSAGPPVGRRRTNASWENLPDVIRTVAASPSTPGLVMGGSNPDVSRPARGFPPVKFGGPLPAGSKDPASGRSTWERIPLGPDLELHAQRPTSRAGNRALERILSSATDILKEEGIL